MQRSTIRIAAWGVVLGVAVIALGVYGANRHEQQLSTDALPNVTRDVKIVADPKQVRTQATSTITVNAQSGEGGALGAWSGVHPEAWLVRSDLTYAAHSRGMDTSSSSFSVAFRPTQPGDYRLVAADTDANTVTIGAVPVAVAGKAEDVPPFEQSAGREGYKIVLSGIPDINSLKAETPTALTFTVSRTDVPVAIDEVDGFRGSMIAFKEGGNLAVRGIPHPSAYLPSPSSAAFAVSFPEPGKYRVFFEFTAGGQAFMEARWIEVAAAQ